MDAERTEFFRGLLNDRMEALLRDAGSAIGHLTSERDVEADPIDLASSETTRDFALRLQDRDRRLIHKLRDAIRRLDEGEYGLCVACGDEIDERRLMARPIATHCIDCKTELEQVERHRRVF